MVNKTTKAMFKNATSCMMSVLLAVSVFLGCLSAYNPESARATEELENTETAMAVNDTPAKEEVQAPAPEAVAPETPAAEAAPIPEAEVAPEAILPAEESLGEQAEEGEAVQDTQESAAEEPGQQNSYPGSGEEATDPAAVTPESNNEDAASSATEGENKEAKDAEKSKDAKDTKDAEKPAAFEASQTVDGVVVSVKAEEGAFPKGSTLSVRKVNASEQSAAEAAVEGKRHEGENVAVSYTFDIKVLDKDKKEIQPAKNKKVEVAFKAAEVANQNLETNVYHLKKEGSLVAESLDTKEQGSTVSAQTTGFSYYTVEFTYGDLQYVMDGDSEIPLSTILDKIGLSGTVTAATSSNPELFSVENNGSDWTVKALQAFCSEETLSLTIDGIDYVIKVTDDVTDDPHNHKHTGWTAWNSTTSLPNAAGKYYLTKNVTLSSSFFFNNTVELCLNGHTITMTGNDNFIGPANNKTLTIYDEPGNSGGIIFNNNRFSVSGVFNLYGGTFKGCTRSYDPALSVSDSGTFNMYGGVFSGNTSGSVLGTSGHNSRLNIYGGEITDNTVYSAPVYASYGTTTISGGTISGNKGNDGAVYATGNGKTYISGGIIKDNIGKRAAVLVSGLTSLYLSGNVQISGNKLEKNGEECNVKLDSNSYRINISGELTNTTPIGITVYTPPTGNNTVEFTKGLNGKGTAANFSSDNPNCAVTIKNNEAHLVSHSHTFNYTAAGDTITAECVNTATPCSLTDNKTTLTIVKPALAKYGGTESAEATFEGAIPGVTPVAEYYKGTEKLDAAPTNAGTYKAQVTLKGSDEKEATAFVDYTIEKADISPVVNIDGWNYGDTPKSPSVTAASNPGSGAATFKYYTDEACTTETSAAQGAEEDGGVPKKGGDYWVQATVAETGNYKSGTGIKKFTIAAKAITVTGLKYGSKVYDGNTDATLDISEAQLVGVQTGDVRIKSATGTFDTKDVGTGKSIGSIVIELVGDDAGGYSATADPATITTGAITPRPVTVSGITAKDKDYDGTTDATVDASEAVFGGIVGDDKLSITATGAFSDANAGTDKTVKLTLGELDGASKGNYVLAESGNQETAKATIKHLPMTVEAEGYDGTYDGGSHSITVTVTEPASGYTITYKGPDAEEYSETNPGFKNQGEYEVSYKVTAPNYETFTGTATVKIAKKPVTVSDIAAKDKTYDGTVAAELEYKDAVLAGKLDGDDVTVSAKGSFSDKNVGEGKVVAIAGLKLEGDDAGNYVLAATGQQETATASITKRPVKVSGITAEEKVYDGNTTATVKTDEAEFENIVGGDALTVSATGAFKDANAGEGKTVKISDLVLGGDSKGNYELASEGQQAETTATITPKQVNVAAEAASKTYGEEDPEFKYTADPLLGEGAYTGALEREAGEKAGTYEIGQGSLTAGDNYEITYTPADFTITKAETNSVTAAIEGWTYGSDPSEPSATATYGQDTATFTYSNKADGEYSSTVPTDAGTYFVKAKIVDTPSYPAAVSEPVEFTIAQKPVTPAMLSLDKESVKKAGSKQGPTITMTDGTVLVEGKDYTLSGETTSDTTGTHFFAVTGMGNYTDSFNSSWYMYEAKQNAATEEGEDGAGNIEIFVDIVGNTESISVNNFTIDFAKALLSEADLAKRAEGANITLYVEVAEVSVGAVPETDRALLKAFFDGKGATDIRWFDIKVWKKVGNDPAAQIHELNSALEMTIEVPSEYKDAPANTTRSFYFGTAHNGAYKLLSETTDKAVSFSSNEFSTFALAYKDVKGNDGKATKSPTRASKTTAKTADGANLPALTCLALVSSLLLAVAALRRRKEEEAK